MKIKFNVTIDLYFVVLRLIGLLIIALSVWAVRFLDGDATHCLITVPLGLACIFTKHRIMDLGILGHAEDPDNF